MKKVLVPIANGTEEMEVVIIIDILRRAGADVILAGSSTKCICSRGIIIEPDVIIDTLDYNLNLDLVAIPGGIAGVNNLIKSDKLKKIIQYNSSTAYIATVCAAPLILKEFGIFPKSAELTSHPSIEGQFGDYKYTTENVVVYKNIITSRGAGTTFDFALKLVELLYNIELANKIANDIVYKR
jgi:DJ-1 family protein